MADPNSSKPNFELLPTYDGVLVYSGAATSKLLAHLESAQVPSDVLAKSVPTDVLCNWNLYAEIKQELKRRKAEGDPAAAAYIDNAMVPATKKIKHTHTPIMKPVATRPAGSSKLPSVTPTLASTTAAATSIQRKNVTITCIPTVESYTGKATSADIGNYHTILNTLKGTLGATWEQTKSEADDTNSKAMTMVNTMSTAMISKMNAKRNKYKFVGIIEGMQNYINFHLKTFGGFTPVEYHKLREVANELNRQKAEKGKNIGFCKPTFDIHHG